MTKRLCKAAAVALASGCLWNPAGALDVTPFYSRNHNPFVLIFGLPAGEPGALTPHGRVDLRFTVDVANNFARGSTPRESLLLDGETHRFNLSLRWGIAQRLELGLDLPYVTHDGGFLDGLIDGWHDTFDLPQSGRDGRDRNELEYVYVRDGEERVRVTSSTHGLGDLQLSAAIPLYRDDGPSSRALALRTGLKLPTGSASNLRGSGSVDLSVRLTATDAATLGRWKLTAYGTAGVLLLGKGDVIDDRQRRVVGFGSLGIGWSPWESLAFKTQLDVHSPFYRSSLKELGASSAQWVFGGTVQLPGNTLLDLGVAEDVAVDTAPDVVFHMSLWRRF